MPVQPIPQGYHSVTPCLVVRGAARLIDFLKQAFAAEEIDRFEGPDGSIMHAEIKIGDSMLMLGEASEQFPAQPAALCLYVPDTDAVYRRAVDAGGTSLREPADQVYGDRSAGVADPSGNSWWIATHVEDVSREEMERRMKQRSQTAA